MSFDASFYTNRPSQSTPIPLGPDGTPSIKEERAMKKAERAQARVIEEQIRPATEFARRQLEEERIEKLRLRWAQSKGLDPND